jgi:hypothetical protein
MWLNKYRTAGIKYLLMRNTILEFEWSNAGSRGRQVSLLSFGIFGEQSRVKLMSDLPLVNP